MNSNVQKDADTFVIKYGLDKAILDELSLAMYRKQSNDRRRLTQMHLEWLNFYINPGSIVFVKKIKPFVKEAQEAVLHKCTLVERWKSFSKANLGMWDVEENDISFISERDICCILVPYLNKKIKTLSHYHSVSQQDVEVIDNLYKI